ncbi:MAG: thioredoxin family protein [Lentisphaeria bacterium]
MKNLIILLTVFFTLNAMSASEIWTTDYAGGVKKAKAENKPVLLLFTGSDWCGWCIKLEGEVFSKPGFETYVRQNLVCVKADFPRKKKQSKEVKAQNRKLQKKYKIRGFPTVVLINPDNEEMINRTGYKKGGPEKYVEHLKELTKKYREKHGEPSVLKNIYEESRTWKDSNGRKLVGTLVAVKDDVIVIRSLTGRKRKAKIKNLCEDDQQLLKRVPPTRTLHEK